MTGEQQQQIALYCYRCGVIYYDVELEVIDHMIEWVEQDMAANRLSFEESLEKMKAVFTGEDCLAIIKSKSRAVRGRIWRSFLQEFQSYFGWPKIVIVFLLTGFIYVIDNYTNINKFPSYAIHLVNLINLSMAFGRGTIVAHNRDDRRLAMVSWKQLLRMQWLLCSLPAVYILFSLTTSLEESSFLSYQIVLYTFPLVFLVMLAWRKVSIVMHERLREDYPRAFAG